MRIPSLYKHHYELVHEGEQEREEVIVKPSWVERVQSWLAYPFRGRYAAPTSIFLGATLLISCIAFWWYPAYSKSHLDCNDVHKGFQCQPEVSHHWGQYSPYFSVPSETPTSVPDGCQLSMVQVLSRHGARYPTFDKSAMYATLILRLKAHVKAYHGKFKFLKDFEYTLGSEDLTVFGQQEMVNSGTKFYERYRSLASKGVPFIRAAGSDRVIMSAQNFSQGFHQARSDDQGSDASDKYPYRIVTISEDEGSNNTLNHGLCEEFEYGPPSYLGDEKGDEWRDHFAPNTTARLNQDLSGADLTNKEVIHLMEMCPFETVASPAGKLSNFCDLFTPDEFRAYDYLQSVSKYYGYSNGSPLGPTQGVGFVNELIARLTAQPVEDHTTVNHTLDADPRSFPIGSQANVFADFSHDNDMVTVFSALGLYNSTKPLPTDRITSAKEAGGFSTSWVVPFGARAYFEKMACDGTDEEMVRVLVNDRVMPLETCGGDKFGRCKLGQFVESLSFASHGGHWDECFI